MEPLRKTGEESCLLAGAVVVLELQVDVGLCDIRDRLDGPSSNKKPSVASFMTQTHCRSRYVLARSLGDTVGVPNLQVGVHENGDVHEGAVAVHAGHPVRVDVRRTHDFRNLGDRLVNISAHFAVRPHALFFAQAAGRVARGV